MMTQDAKDALLSPKFILDYGKRLKYNISCV